MLTSLIDSPPDVRLTDTGAPIYLTQPTDSAFSKKYEVAPTPEDYCEQIMDDYVKAAAEAKEDRIQHATVHSSVPKRKFKQLLPSSSRKLKQSPATGHPHPTPEPETVLEVPTTTGDEPMMSVEDLLSGTQPSMEWETET